MSGALLLAALALLAGAAVIPAVAGPTAQPPNPAMVAYRLLDQVPALTGDVPLGLPDVDTTPSGRTAFGYLALSERGRLVPLPVPGHPWLNVARGPKRSIVAEAYRRSGGLEVWITYTAQAGDSRTSVVVRRR